ncbi:MAG: hypothetical protein RLY31_2172 [Bacteroidota bacterium]
MEFCSPLRGEGHAALGTGVEEREGFCRFAEKLVSSVFVIRQFGLRLVFPRVVHAEDIAIFTPGREVPEGGGLPTEAICMKKMKNPYVWLFLAVPWWLAAQELRGRVTDLASGQPLAYATIRLHSWPDSLLMDGTVTDADGLLGLPVRRGMYYVVAEYLSYTPVALGPFPVGAEGYDLGVLRMMPASAMLEEVVVQAERSTMQLSLDKRVFHVGKDLANAGGNAAELLSNIPSVQVDLEGNVSLRGSGNVRILIDGKPSGLVSLNGSSGLQQLQGNLVERVEIITNPGARYEAEGVGGIINIILRKDRRQGLNGSFDLVTGQPANHGITSNLNFRRRNLNFFTNYGLSFRRVPGDGSLYQRVLPGDSVLIYRQEHTRDNPGLYQNIRGGLDYFLRPDQSLTFAYTWRRSDGIRRMDITNRDFVMDESLPTGISHRLQDEKETELNAEYSLQYKNTFGREGHALEAELRILDYWEESDQDFVEKFLRPDGSPGAKDDLLQHSYNYETERQYLGQVDYRRPFGPDGKLELGGRSALRNMDNDFQVTSLSNGTWETLPGLDNRFRYDEHIHALYGTLGNKSGKISYLAGLRAEWTDLTTALVETDEVHPRRYANVFPSAHLTYSLPADHAVQLSYSRRIRRPQYFDLSPFVTYSDNRNYWGGNPDLDPEFTHALEVGHIKYFGKGTLASSLYYRHTTGKIERIRRVDSEGVANTRPENLLDEHAFGLEVTDTYQPVAWCRLDGAFNFFRAVTDGGNLGADIGRDTYSWFARATARFTWRRGTDIQWRAQYEARQRVPQGTREPIFFVDLAFSQDLPGEDATLTLNVSDLFNRRRYRTESVGASFYTYSDAQWRRRQINLTFSYRLHQQKKKNGSLLEEG